MRNKKSKVNKYFIKRIFGLVSIFVFLFGAIIFPINKANAQVFSTNPIDTMSKIGKNLVQWAKEWYWTASNELTATFFTKAMYSMLDQFTQNMAKKVATGISTGAKGGEPLAFTQNMEDYLKESADIAAGDFIEGLGKAMDVDLCDSGISKRLKFSLALIEDKGPKKPKCTLSKMKEKWSESMQDKDFLKNFSVAFESGQSDFGVYLKLQERLKNLESKKKEADKTKRLANPGGTKPVEDKVTKNIKTTQNQIKILEESSVNFPLMAKLAKLQAAAAQSEKKGITSILESGFYTFAASLYNQVATDFLSGVYTAQDFADLDWGGMASKLGGGAGNLKDPYSQNTSGGKLAAEMKYAKYIRTKIIDSGVYDILPELSSCSDPQKPGPTTCVIDSNFASAIQDKMTLQEAVDDGLIDGNKTVGFNWDGSEPEVVGNDTGYPYRSLLILRKYRIIPVGWELAALYFKNYKEPDTKARLTLNKLLESYGDDDSPYYRLVDPNWVLKVPSGYCKAKGIGPEILNDMVNAGMDMNKDGDWNDFGENKPSRSVVRNDQYCADEQSCIKENIDGTCGFFGYCMEERRVWEFDGDACEDTYNTCQAFTTPKGRIASYLKNSLDWDACNVDNSGCQWYCNEFNSEDNIIADANPIAYWSMDEFSSNVVKDDSVNNNIGTVKNKVTSDSGKWGKSLKFDGNGGYVEVGNNDSLNLTSSVSIEAWVKISTDTGKAQTIVSKANDYKLIIRDNGLIDFWIGDLSVVYGTSDLADDKWHHVVATYDGTTAKVYVDQNPEYQVGTNVFLNNSNTSILIGADDSADRPFNGNIDEVAIYDRALSLSEIQQHYAGRTCILKDDKIYLSGKVETCEETNAGCGEYLNSIDGLVGYWQLEEDEGLISYDSSGYRNEGILNYFPSDDSQWVDGFRGRALNFDGLNDHIKIDNDIPVNLDGMTVGFWMNFDDTGVWSSMVSKSVSGGTDGFTFNVGFGGTGLGNSITISTSDANGQYNSKCPFDMTDYANQWVNVVAVWNVDGCKIYVDGENVASEKTLLGMNTLKNFPVYLGTGFGAVGVSYSFDGRLDEVSIWNRTLSDVEVFDLYNNGISFSSNYVKTANKNQQCYGRTAGDPFFDLPVDTDNCISLGLNYGSSGEGSCFEFLPQKEENSCVNNNGTWFSNAVKISRNTSESACEGSGGVWGNGGCQTNCLKIDDQICENYAFSCKVSEVGCEEYTPTRGGASIPGVTGGDDLCPSECSGYDSYKQESTNFETSEFPVEFIPNTANSCSRAAAGCDEFTNLDAIAAGGESLEYYTYLRQCEKIPTVAANYQCGNFYTWVGSDVTGYKLQGYFLKADQFRDLNNDGVIDEDDEESVEILRIEENLGKCENANDALINENCKEFYNSAGVISYHLLQKTISCSNECVDYRKTAPVNYDLAQVCTNIGGSWTGNSCVTNTQESCNIVGGRWTGLCNPSSIVDNEFCESEKYLTADWGVCSGGSLTSTSCTSNGGIWRSGVAECVNLSNSECTQAGGSDYESVCTKTDYKAISEEGLSCPASSDGCREYTGSAASNIMTVFDDSLESKNYIYNFPNDTNKWDGSNGWTGGALSSESIIAGQKSLRVETGVDKTIDKWMSASCVLDSSCTDDQGCPCTEAEFETGAASSIDDDNDSVTNDVVCTVPLDDDRCYVANYTYNEGTYLFSFWAKGNNGNEVSIDIVDNVNPANIQNFGIILLSDQWQYYNLGPVEFNVARWNNYKLSFSGIDSGIGAAPLSAYFDNIILESVFDHLYLIKNSWNTPAVCDQDLDGVYAKGYMLGCEEYVDSQSNLHYLKSFTNLCREEAVGCRQFIDTYNSSSSAQQTWNNDDASEITVPADNLVYLARTNDYACFSEDAGCSIMGTPSYNQDKTNLEGFSTLYQINDPDKYDTILCLKENVGCQTFSSGTAEYYFKDPGDRVCEYVKPVEVEKFGWYKKAASYDVDSEKCPIFDYQNFGVDFPSGICVGGVEEGADCVINTDSGSRCIDGGGYCNNWAGVCPAVKSSCTAFVDPLSEIEVNEVINGSFDRDLDSNNNPDSWINSGTVFQGLQFYNSSEGIVGVEYNPSLVPIRALYQEIDISPDKTYTISADIAKNDTNADAVLEAQCVNYGARNTECASSIDKGFYVLDAGEIDVTSECADTSNIKNIVRLNISQQKLTEDFDRLKESDDVFQRYSFRVFAGSCNKIRLAFGAVGTAGAWHKFDNVSLKETGVYYYLDSTLDEAKKECGGFVDYEQGCALFNNRDNTSWQSLDYKSHLTYNADVPSFTPTNCEDDDCNADVLIKASPDRVCDKWLYCNTTETINDKEYCAGVGLCDKMNETGQCVNYPVEYSSFEYPDLLKAKNMTFDVSEIDQIKNLSGYSKVGMIWGIDQKVEGQLSPAQMKEVGASALVFNGNFERATQISVPLVSNPQGPQDYDYSWKPLGWDLSTAKYCRLSKNDCNQSADCDEYDSSDVCSKSCSVSENACANDSACGENVCVPGGSVQICSISGLSCSDDTYCQPNNYCDIDGKCTVGGNDCSDDSQCGQDVCIEEEVPYQVCSLLVNGIRWTCSENVDCPANTCQGTCSNYTDISCQSDVDCRSNACFTPNDDWSVNKFDLVDNPITAQKENIEVLNGRSVLRVYAGDRMNDSMTGDFISVSGETDYIISGYVNTKYLKFQNQNKQAYGTIIVYQYNENGDRLDLTEPSNSDYGVKKLILKGGFDWTLLQSKLKIGSKTDYLKIRLGSLNDDQEYCDNDCSGKVYFDDIYVRPELQTEVNLNPDYNYTPRSCRLYPEADSLSCNYVGDNGWIYKGWSGYCLEKDPANSDYCLLWWPVDQIRDADISDLEGFGISPAYYCLQSSNQEVMVTGSEGSVISASDPGNHCGSINSFTTGGSLCMGPSGGVFEIALNNWMVDGPSKTIDLTTVETRGTPSKMFFEDNDFVVELGCGSGNDRLEISVWDDISNKYKILGRTQSGKTACECQDFGHGYTDCYSVSKKLTHYSFDLNKIGVYKTNKIKFKVIRGTTESGPEVGWWSGRYTLGQCQVISQVSTLTGKNQAWLSRLAKGSAYAIDDLDYKYNQDFSPFGLIAPPEPVEKPTKWPALYTEQPGSGLARASSPYSCVDGGTCFASFGPGGIPLAIPDTNGAEPNIRNAIRRVQKIFADSYAAWVWNDSSESYQPVDATVNPEYFWNPPVAVCSGPDGARPVFGDDYCAVIPKLENIEVNNKRENIIIEGGGMVGLSFNSIVDPQQLPMVRYLVDWRDANKISISNVSLNNKPNIDSPHKFGHEYTYVGLLLQDKPGEDDGIVCGDRCSDDVGCRLLNNESRTAFCRVRPKVQIQDNWGWCSNGLQLEPCPSCSDRSCEVTPEIYLLSDL